MAFDALAAATVYGDDTALAPVLDAAREVGVRLITAQLPESTSDSFSDWVTRPSAAVIEQLRQIDLADSTHAGSTPLAVVWVFPAVADPNRLTTRAAAVEALRGIVQSVTREKAHVWAPTNGIAGQVDDLDSVLSALTFLGDPDGGFTAGSTFDLTPRVDSAR